MSAVSSERLVADGLRRATWHSAVPWSHLTVPKQKRKWDEAEAEEDADDGRVSYERFLSTPFT